MVEKAIRMAWRDWLGKHDKGGDRFIDENMNLTMEYYHIKNAYIAGYKQGEVLHE